MIVSVISFLIAKRFSAISPDLKQLAEEGKIFTREHDQNLLLLLHTPDLIDHDVQEISIYASFTELIELISVGKKNFIAVTNDDHVLEGIILLDDIRPVMFNKELYDELNVQKVMVTPPAVIDAGDDVREIVKKFDETNTWNLPVVDQHRFVGFISKSSVLNRYRQLLKEYSG
jgi:CIC family chloride channel protein